MLYYQQRNFQDMLLYPLKLLDASETHNPMKPPLVHSLDDYLRYLKETLWKDEK